MREYIFNYTQGALIKYDLNLKDALILDYLKNFFKNGAQSINYNGKDYFRIYYKKILNDLPILNISYDRLREIIRRLEDKGFIEKWKQDINSSMLFLKLNDRPLVYNMKNKTFIGKDTMLTNFITRMWKDVKVNKKITINIIKNENENFEEFVYNHPLIKTSLILSNEELFKKILFTNLEIVLSDTVFKMLNKNRLYFINNQVRLYTNTLDTLQLIFEENMYKIEQAICLSVIELFKII